MYLLTNTSISTLFVSQGGVTIKLYPYESVTLDEAQAKSFKELNESEALILTSVDGSPLPDGWVNGVQDQEAAKEAIANIPNIRAESSFNTSGKPSSTFEIMNDREKLAHLEGEKKRMERKEEISKKLEELQKDESDTKKTASKPEAGKTADKPSQQPHQEKK